MIKSMTAFARKQQEGKEGILVWEVRSVNGRYLDVSFRLPELFRHLETELRSCIKNYLSRGKIDCHLRFQSIGLSDQSIELNTRAILQLNSMTTRIKKIFRGVRKPTALDVLRWPGILLSTGEEKNELKKAAIHLFKKTLLELNDARGREGEKLKVILHLKLDDVLEQTEKVKILLPKILKLHKEKLKEKVGELQIKIDADRLEQEIVLLAQKIDVAEEIDRLIAHVEEVKRILENDDVSGRRLDFLMQELNREANTLGAKSVDEETAHVSVELKVLIEQMREQVQNIE